MRPCSPQVYQESPHSTYSDSWMEPLPSRERNFCTVPVPYTPLKQRGPISDEVMLTAEHKRSQPWLSLVTTFGARG